MHAKIGPAQKVQGDNLLRNRLYILVDCVKGKADCVSEFKETFRMTSNTAKRTSGATSDFMSTLSDTLEASTDDRMWNNAVMSNSCNTQHNLSLIHI